MRSQMIYQKEESFCADCEEHYFKKQNCAEFLKSIVKQLYTNKVLDKEQLEDDLENLCNMLEVPFISKEDQLTIERTRPNWLKEWVSQNNAHMEALAHK